MLNILIHDNNKLLNRIFEEQFLKCGYSLTFNSEDKKKLSFYIKNNPFDILILGFNPSISTSSYIFEEFISSNRYGSIILLYNQEHKKFLPNLKYIRILQKPFRMKSLLDLIYDIGFSSNQKIKLMENLLFYPVNKIICNIKNEEKVTLTEKENQLLKFFILNKNIEISKGDILKEIWGIKPSINTHTLETHLYRLKKKINRLKIDLSFSFVNRSNFYCLRYK